jgi:predicted protein tyrosine phosphatase
MIYVCNLVEMPLHVAALRPSHLVSLNNPDELPQTPGGLSPDNHLRLGMHDISAPQIALVAPDREQVAALLAFLKAWPGQAPLLLHCYAGISRSMAAALLALHFHHFADFTRAARWLRRSAAHANPNRRIVQIADELLGARGALIDAAQAMGDCEPLEVGPLVRVAP